MHFKVIAQYFLKNLSENDINTPNTSPTLENDALIVNCFYEVLFVLKLKYILCI